MSDLYDIINEVWKMKKKPADYFYLTLIGIPLGLVWLCLCVFIILALKALVSILIWGV